MSLFPKDLSPTRVLLFEAGAALVVAVLIAGCGNSYRPVITPINPTGPAAQPISYAVVISTPSPTANGVATVIDYAGDTIMAQAPIGPNPTAFTLDANGANGYTLNSDHTLTNFEVSSTQPQEKNIYYSTLPPTAQVLGLFSPVAGLWAPDQNQNVVDVMAISGSAEAFKLAIPVATTPISVVGLGSLGQQVYSVSQNVPFDVTCNNSPSSVTQNGEADALEVASYTVAARIPVGVCPVYGVASPDGRRIFVLNRGSDNITVINSQDNALDQCTPFTNQNGQLVTCHPSLPLSTTAGLTGANVPTVAGPVYAEYIPATEELVVADYDGGTISLIDVSLDEYGNDSPTFGTTYTIPVGNTATPNPASVTVLSDGSKAYTANQNDGTQNGTVTVINMSTHTVERTLTVVGHPRTVLSTQNSEFSKVYAVSPDSPYLTVLESTPTTTDQVDTTILVEGNIVDARVTSQNGGSGNSNFTSRVPGYGQPCNLPTSQLIATYGASYTLANCQQQ